MEFPDYRNPTNKSLNLLGLQQKTILAKFCTGVRGSVKKLQYQMSTKFSAKYKDLAVKSLQFLLVF